MNSPATSPLSFNGLTFAHVSDLHLPFEPQLDFRQRFSKRQLSVWSWRRRRAVQRPEILEALRSDLQAHGPDRVLITGDITNFSLPGEFTAAADWLASLALPVSLVPGNHDALVPVAHDSGFARWDAWTGAVRDWPWLSRQGEVAFIGLCSALPTAPLRASGRLGAAQLERLEQLLREEGAAGRTRVVMLHHPVADGAVRWRKALTDRRALRAVLLRAGAELVLHGHARYARLDSIAGPRAPIPVLCVPSSSALPNRHDEAARWHRVTLPAGATGRWARVTVRQWSPAAAGFVDAASYELRLPDVG